MKTKTIILIAIGVIAVAGVGYYFTTRPSHPLKTGAELWYDVGMGYMDVSTIKKLTSKQKSEIIAVYNSEKDANVAQQVLLAKAQS